MRCSRRSTTWLGSALVVLATWATLSARASSPQAAPDDDAQVRAAIADAVRARIGVGADVRVEDVVVKVTRRQDGRLVATPEPGARLGRSSRFSLSFRLEALPAVTRVAGFAVATVSVVCDCARVSRPVAAGAVLSHEDVVAARAELGAVGLLRVPVPADVVGARANRPLQPGELVMAGMVSTRRLVQSGENVLVRVRGEGVEVEGRAVAAQGGGAGDVIRVVNPTSRRAVMARIVGPGEVEVIR